MRKKFLFLILLMLPAFVYAQEAPSRRVVFLWDVTNTMHGGYLTTKDNTDTVQVAGRSMTIKHYNCDYDIYDQILETLVGEINKYRENDEVIVVPFNDHVLKNSIWRSRATEEGKRQLEAQIRAFYNSDQTNTNLYEPFEFANMLFDGSKYPMAKDSSMLFVLTDGVHNFKNPSRRQFLDMLGNWCATAEQYNVRGYYFMLTDRAIKDSELLAILKNSTCIRPYIWYETHFYTIEGNRMITVMHGEYDKPICLSVIPVDPAKPINDEEQIRIYAEPNDYFTLNQTVTINAQTTSIEVKPVYKGELYDLQRALPRDCNQKVTIYLEQVPQQRAEGEIVNELQTQSCVWEFVNKAQKTLTIKIKRN